MIEITGVAMGVMMTGVAVAIGVFTLEATLLMMCRALQPPPLLASLKPAVLHVS